MVSSYILIQHTRQKDSKCNYLFSSEYQVMDIKHNLVNNYFLFEYITLFSKENDTNKLDF